MIDDEIERLRKENEKLTTVMQGDMGLAAIQKAVIEDMRAWADSGIDAWRPSIARRVIDAYTKDRKLDD